MGMASTDVHLKHVQESDQVILYLFNFLLALAEVLVDTNILHHNIAMKRIFSFEKSCGLGLVSV